MGLLDGTSGVLKQAIGTRTKYVLHSKTSTGTPNANTFKTQMSSNKIHVCDESDGSFTWGKNKYPTQLWIKKQGLLGEGVGQGFFNTWASPAPTDPPTIHFYGIDWNSNLTGLINDLFPSVEVNLLINSFHISWTQIAGKSCRFIVDQYESNFAAGAPIGDGSTYGNVVPGLYHRTSSTTLGTTTISGHTADFGTQTYSIPDSSSWIFTANAGKGGIGYVYRIEVEGDNWPDDLTEANYAPFMFNFNAPTPPPNYQPTGIGFINQMGRLWYASSPRQYHMQNGE